jgi:hypothetical protein
MTAAGGGVPDEQASCAARWRGYRISGSADTVSHVLPWRWVVLPVLALMALSGCGLSGPVPAPSPSLRSFSYEIASPTAPITAGAPLHLVWAPHVDPNFQTGVADTSLCFGIFGPWADAATVKSIIDRRDPATASCPLGGAVVISDVIHTTSAAGEQFGVDMAGPREPGFYDFQQVVIAVNDRGGSTMVVHRILEVRSR